MKKIFLPLIAVLLFFVSGVLAETISLKNSSRSFQGKIVEKTEEYVVLDTGDGKVVKIPFSKMDEETIARLKGISVPEEEKPPTVRTQLSGKEDYYTKALEWAKAGDLPAALKNIELAIQEGKDLALVYRLKGDILYETGEFKESIVAYTLSLSQDPYVSDIYCKRGHAYFLFGDEAQAMADYTQGIKLDKENSLCLGSRGDLYLLHNELDKAQEDFEQLLKIQEDSVQAKIGLGNVWLGKEDPDKALDYYEEVIDKVTDNGELYANMALASFLVWDIEEAKEYIKKAESLGFPRLDGFKKMLEAASREDSLQ